MYSSRQVPKIAAFPSLLAPRLRVQHVGADGNRAKALKLCGENDSPRYNDLFLRCILIRFSEQNLTKPKF